MEQNAEAIYENGVLRPVSALRDLAEGQRVFRAAVSEQRQRQGRPRHV